jgi:diguanylate cyclase (GGDEF)-like protein/PAS domain S-box-containing protein
MIMPTILFWSVLSGLLIACSFFFYFRKNRQDSAVEKMTREILQISGERGAALPLAAEGQSQSLIKLSAAVNTLLESLRRRGGNESDRDQLFQRLVESVHEGVLVQSETILFANARFLDMLGASAQDIVGKRLSDFVVADYAELLERNSHRRLAGEPSADRYEIELAGPKGQITRVELSSILIQSEGRPALLFTAMEMLPESSSEVSISHRPRALATLDSMDDGVITVEADGRIDYVNHAAITLLGQNAAELSGKAFAVAAVLIDEVDRRPIADPVRKALTTGIRVTVSRRAVLVPASGSPERSVEINVSPIRADDGAAVGAVIVLHDISELRGITRQMTYQASHDGLTGLINRREFERRLQETIDSAQTDDLHHALCYLDLDRFKVVNDSSGHTAGDNMLREIATIIRDAVRDSDSVGRIGGDEFALLLVGCPLDKARQIADDVVRSVNSYRFVWKDRIFNVGVSVGLVEIGRDAGTLQDVMDSADSACYVAKKQGGVHIYSSREEVTARQRGDIYWLQRLQTALRDGKFELYYQPIVHAHIGGVRGPAFEVFVRLLSDNDGPSAPPAEFMQAAERYRLMPHIDRWVVQAVLDALGRGGLKVPKGRSVAINIAAQTLGDADFLEFVVNCFDHTGATPQDICFEITENAVVANLDHAHRFIEVLHGMGCEFALDDFGGGLSSFANLKTLPINYLKIDGSFIRDLGVDTVNQAVVAAMIDLSRSLNFRVVAEQIEDQSSLDKARQMGIDFLQGFIIARPLPLTMTPVLL